MATQQMPDPEGLPSNQRVKQPKDGKNPQGDQLVTRTRKQGRQPMNLDDEQERDRKDTQLP